MSEPTAPAKVAALLRRRLARLDAERRTRAGLIEALDAYSTELKVANITAGQVAGRLRRLAARYDSDADSVRRQRRATRTGRAAA
jgi:hypothetical protein